jgi:hypothetical protein
VGGAAARGPLRQPRAPAGDACRDDAAAVLAVRRAFGRGSRDDPRDVRARRARRSASSDARDGPDGAGSTAVHRAGRRAGVRAGPPRTLRGNRPHRPDAGGG